MIKEIQVYAADGSVMTPTFYKRARQLVKSGRATWVNDSAICLEEHPKEESVMEEYISNDGTRKLEELEILKTETEIPDEDLLKMAKKRVEERSALIIHITSYVAVNIFLATFMGDWQVYVLGGWGIGLACHIATYFTAATPESIQKEYLKIKHKHRL